MKPKIAIGSKQQEDSVDLPELVDLLGNGQGGAMDGQDGAENTVGKADGSDGAGVTDDTGASSESHSEAPPKRRFKRHSDDQIQGLKAMFEIRPNPNEMERLEISKMLGMEATQVMHWFQNQRSQKKAQNVRQEGKELREENETLRNEHLALKAAILMKTCSGCGGPEVPPEQTPEQHRLRKENARLKEEIMAASAALKSLSRNAAAQAPPAQLTASSGSGGGALVLDPMAPLLPAHPGPALEEDPAPPIPNGDADADHTALPLLLERAMAEFLTLVRHGEPMWLPTADGEELDENLYAAATSPGLFGPRPVGFSMEGTRATAMVAGTAADIVGVLTDVVVGSAAPSAHQDGLIQLVNAELRVPSPRAPVRSVNFLRHSKLLEPGTWAVVDASVDGFDGRQHLASPAGYTACRLLPSGCLVEDLNNGYSKVTWIVNAEYDEATAPQLRRPPLCSGQALATAGARGCLTSLQRHCEHLAILRYGRITNLINPALSPAGRRSVLELAQQMTASFYAAVRMPVGQTQAPAASHSMESRRSFRLGAEFFDVVVRAGALPPSDGAAPGDLVLSGTATVWLPGAPVHRVFDYLCDLDRRGEWDALVAGAGVELESYLATGQLHGNASVSVLRPSGAGAGGSNGGHMILQQACTDASSSLLVYAPIEEGTMRAVMNGGGVGGAPVFVLPSGFAILPDGYIKEQAPDASAAQSSSTSTSSAPTGSDGSLVTAMFQTLQSGPPSETLTAACMEDVGKLLCYAVGKIMVAAVTA